VNFYFSFNFHYRVLLSNLISVPDFFVFGGGVAVGGALAAGLVPSFLSFTSLLEAFIVSVIMPSIRSREIYRNIS
jgi:hypothetical protein